MFHIIDDHSHISGFVAEVVAEFGRQSRCFSHAEEYLTYVRSPEYIRPLAVITDIHMTTQMSGYDMIHEVRSLGRQTRFVVMTGEPHLHSDHKDAACMYLYKPFRVEKLEAIIDRLLACEATEPACRHGCGRVADRSHFGVSEWQCPHGCVSCGSSGCGATQPK